MIILTEAAKERFRALWPEVRPGGKALRLDKARSTAHTNGGEPKLAVYLAEPEERDDPVAHGGEPLLYVSRRMSAAFDGCLVDLLQSPQGFVVGPPETGRGAR